MKRARKKFDAHTTKTMNSSIVENTIDDLLGRIVTYVSHDETRRHIEHNVIDPIVDYAFRRLYPYMIFTSVIFFMIFLLTLCILLIVISV